MRVPGRLHITWADESTLKMDLDAGTQTRTFHFNAPPPADEKPSLEGYSLATWDGPAPGRGARGPMRAGSLKVVTTRLRPGYFRKNGIPYSANAVLTEYFTTLTDTRTDYLVVTNFLEDPQYLAQPYVRSVQFKRQPDAKGWNPTQCSAR